jgi:hypothetical protein
VQKTRSREHPQGMQHSVIVDDQNAYAH